VHGPATVVSQTGRVVRLLHGGEYKTRNTSDVEQFEAADPLPSQAADPGAVGAALWARRHAVLPPAGASATLASVASPAPLTAQSVPPPGRLDLAAAMDLVVLGASVAARHAFLPPAVLA